MLKYDKILIDVSNLYHRVLNLVDYQDDLNILKKLTKNNVVLQQYINTVNKFLNSTLGEVDLLFDPLNSSGELSKRQQLNDLYKINRSKDKLSSSIKRDNLNKLYSYYVINNVSRVNVYYSNEYEADDFVAKLTEKGNCLLITSDNDWARYLEKDRVEMLSKGFSVIEDNIIDTVKWSQNEKHPFIPNESSVTLWKVLYGDASDGIEGVFLNKKFRILRDASDEAMNLIKYLGENPSELSVVKLKFFNGIDQFEKLNKLLNLTSTSKSYEKLFNTIDQNFQLIESFLPRSSDIDIEKFHIKLNFNNKHKKSFSLNS